MDGVVDKLGLVREGYPVLIYLPAYNAVVPLLVKARLNKGYEVFEYGPLPDCGTNLTNGVLIPGSLAEGCLFSYTELPSEYRPDMFYYTDNDRLLHVHAYIRPMFLRILLEIPIGTKTYSFRGIVVQRLDRDFGWFRHYKEIVFPPRIHVGWSFFNPSTLPMLTHARFIIGEYLVEPLLDRDALVKILMGRSPAYQVTFGGMNRFREIEEAVETWGAVMVERLPSWASEEEVRQAVDRALSR